jgi:hypothetical protein
MFWRENTGAESLPTIVIALSTRCGNTRQIGGQPRVSFGNLRCSRAWCSPCSLLPRDDNLGVESMPINFRQLFNPTIAGLLACAVTASTPARAQSWEPSALPDTSGVITVVGCFTRGGPHHMYVLTRPTTDPVNSVTEEACSAPYDEKAIELKDTGKFHLNRYNGHWLEITGRLEKLEGTIDSDDVRELHVRSFRVMPIAAPRSAAVPSTPNQQASSEPQSFGQPLPAPPAIVQGPTPGAVGTTGTVETAVLPGTASNLSAIGLLGLLSLAAAFVTRIVNRRSAVQNPTRSTDL